jgi:hypothetical protein
MRSVLLLLLLCSGCASTRLVPATTLTVVPSVVPLTVKDVQGEILKFYSWLQQSKQLLTHYRYKGWPEPKQIDPVTGEYIDPPPPPPLTPERLDEVLKEMPAESSSPM